MAFRDADDIIRDDSKGASELAIDVVDSVLELDIEDVREYVKKIVKNRYIMTPLINICNEILLCIEKGKDLESKVKHLKNELISNKKKAARETRDLLKNKDQRQVLTLSYSSTVIAALKEVEKVVVLESRPKKEGRKTSKKLAERSKKVQYWIDAGMYKALREVDAVVVGGDTISKEGFLNKIGSRPLSVVSEDMDKEFYVVADNSKLLPSNIPVAKEEIHPSQEVWNLEEDLNVDVRNDYFEFTPLDKAKFITEEGLKEQEEIKKLCKEKEVSNTIMDLHPLI